MGEVGVVVLGMGGGVRMVARVGEAWVVLDFMVIEGIILIMAVVLELFTGIAGELMVGQTV